MVGRSTIQSMETLPFAFGQVDSFEFATLARAFGLVDLTFPASLDMLLDFCTQVGKDISALQQFGGLGGSPMSRDN